MRASKDKQNVRPLLFNLSPSEDSAIPGISGEPLERAIPAVCPRILQFSAIDDSRSQQRNSFRRALRLRDFHPGLYPDFVHGYTQLLIGYPGYH